MCALHRHLGKSGHDVQVCVTGRGARCERTSEDHGVTSAGQSLLPFDLLLLFPPSLFDLLRLPLPSHMPNTHCNTTPHTA